MIVPLNAGVMGIESTVLRSENREARAVLLGKLTLIHGGVMGDKDKKKKRKKVLRPGVHVRKGRKAAPSREKLADDFDDDEDGIFTAQDYIDVLGFDPFEDDESEDEKH
jgi:hypothetical protein